MKKLLSLGPVFLGVILALATAQPASAWDADHIGLSWGGQAQGSGMGGGTIQTPEPFEAFVLIEGEGTSDWSIEATVEREFFEEGEEQPLDVTVSLTIDGSASIEDGSTATATSGAYFSRTNTLYMGDTVSVPYFNGVALVEIDGFVHDDQCVETLYDSETLTAYISAGGTGDDSMGGVAGYGATAVAMITYSGD